MANKKISQLFENPYPRTGDIFPIVQDGVTYKVTLDNVNRLTNDEYFVTHNLDPYILDDLSNYYGRYRFISGNLMISGKGLDANLPHPGSCVLRLYDGNFILNGSGIISGLNSGVTDLGHTNNTKGLYSITIGQFNVSSGTRNEIFGSRNNATGIDLKIFGDLNNVLGNNDRIFSTGNFASGSDITIVGENNYITGSDHHVHGHNNTLNSNDVKIFGNYNSGLLFSTGSFIVGENNFVGNSTEAGANSLVYGDYNKISGKNSLVYGRNNLIKIKSGALEKISVYGLENDVSGIEVDVYGRLNLNSGLTNQIYGHSNTGYGDINFVAGTYNRIQKPSVENHIYGDYNILTRGSGNFVVGRRNEASANTSDLIGECIFVSGTGNWVGGKDSNVTGIDIISLGKDINITHYGNFSNVVGRGNTINGSGYYSDVYGSDNLNSGFKAIIVGKNNTNSLISSETTIVGRINESYNEKQVIVGERNIATAPRSYTVGQNNDNHGTSGYIFGEENLIYEDNSNSYIIGRSNSSNSFSNNAYIFGLNNIASEYNNNNYIVGSGNSNNDFSENNISVGYNNNIDGGGDNLNVFGRNNLLYNNNSSTVVGKSNTLNDNGSGNYVFGESNILGNSNPDLRRASVFGSGNTIDANDSATYGYDNTVTTTSTRSHVFGLGNISSGADAVIVGSGNRNSGVNSMVVGYGNINTLSGSNSNIFGRGNTSHANNLSVYGSGNHVTGADSATYGYGNRVASTATRSHVFGFENVSSGANNNILGSGNRVSSFNSIVIGYGNENQFKATGTDVFGRGNLLNDQNTKIYGSDNRISGSNSAIYGDSNSVFINSSSIDIIGDGNTVRSGSNTININGDGNILNTGANSIFIFGNGNFIDSGTSSSRIYGTSNTISATGNYIKNLYRIIGYGPDFNYNSSNFYGNENLDSGYSNNIYGDNNTLNTGAAQSYVYGKLNQLNSLQQFEDYLLPEDQLNPSFDNFIFGESNLITGRETFTVGAYNTGRQNTSGYMFGRRNFMASGLTGSTIIGNEIVFPISGNAGYKLSPNNMSNAMQIGVNNSGKITILQNGNIGIGTSGTLPFENPQELLHVRSGNVLLDATEGGYFKFYDKNRYDNIPDNPSQVGQPGDIRAIVSGGNFKIDGDLILSTGIGETGQFLKGRIFQEAFTRNLDGSMWCYAPSDLQGNCTNASANPYNNNTESITGTDGATYTHKVGLWQPYGFDLGWDAPTTTYASGYVSGFIQNISTREGSIAKPDFCNGDCNFDYQPHEIGRIGGRAITFLDGNPTSAIITGRYTLINTPIMKTTNLYLPPVNQNSGVLYTVKNLGQGNIMVFCTGSERIDLFFTGFMIDQRFASYEFLSNGSGWFLV